MTFSSLNFGDVFVHEGKEYIFLAKSTVTIYTADILDDKSKENIERLCEVRIRKSQPIDDSILYCYVILKTKELNGKMVHFALTGKRHFHSNCKKLTINLIKDDLDAIKNEIMKQKAIVIELKSLIKDIKIF